MKTLQIFNQYLEKGGEEASVDRIWNNLGETVELERCMFTSKTWTGHTAPPIWKQALWTVHNPGSLRQLREVHDRFRPDCWLVHNVFPVGSAGVYNLACRLEMPVTYYIHNFRPFSVNGYLWANDALAPGGLKRNYWQEIRHGAWQESRVKTAWLASILTGMHALRLFRCVRSWIAISHFMKGKFVEAGVPEEDIFVIPHFWNPLPQPPSEPEGDYYLFLGRLVTQKGVRVLLSAWEILRGEMGAECPRLVIGGPGPLADEVAAAAEGSEKIEFVGEVHGDEKHRLLSGCRALLAPSIWWEPLGLVAYEAYDYGKPLLAADSGGLVEAVQPGESGLLHEPGHARALAEDILRINADPGQRREMGRAGREWLLENTGRDQWLERVRQALRHCVRLKR
jgi:glycosyltransferase involved in cell wall biosynthesis